MNPDESDTEATRKRTIRSARSGRSRRHNAQFVAWVNWYGIPQTMGYSTLIGIIVSGKPNRVRCSRYRLVVPGDGGNARMKRSAVICIVLAVIFVALALFSYFYESRSTGLLPVITYPMRPYTIPFAITGAILACCGIFIHKSRRK
jgi:hypothetical protein